MHNIKAIDSNLVSRISTISVQSPAFQELAIKAASMSVLSPGIDEYVIFLNKVQEACTLSQDIKEALCDDIEENRNIIAKNKFIDVFYKYTT